MKKLTDGRVQCEVEGCGKICKTEGQMRLHEQLKHGEGKPGASKGNPPATKVTCPDCGGSNIRLLNSGVKAEKAAMNEGYRKICRDCEEVMK